MRRRAAPVRPGWAITHPIVAAALGLGLAMLAWPALAKNRAELEIVEGSHIRMDIVDGRAEVMQVLHIRNTEDAAVDPKDELLLSLPGGARDVRGDRELMVDPLHGTVSVPGPFPPGVSLVRLVFTMPVERGRLDYHQPLETAAKTMHVILPEMKGVEISGEAVLRVARREAEGIRLLVVDVDATGGRIAFSISGLPRRGEPARWIALALSTAILLIGIAMGTRTRPLHDGERERAEADRKAILAELEQLEIDRTEGLINDEDYESDRDDLIMRLASTLRVQSELSGGGK